MKILMVCLGNICRSPLAQGILLDKLNKRGINGIEVDSCGTSGYHYNDPPDPRSIEKAAEYDIDITMFRGRKFKTNDFEKFDHILVMDRQNYEDILSLTESEEDKVKVRMVMDCLYPGEHIDVPDPYYGEEDGFEKVYQMLDQAIEQFIEAEISPKLE